MLKISRKKKSEFDLIFELKDINNFYLEIDLFRKLFKSDFFDNFILHIQNNIDKLLETQDNFFIHININTLCLSDLINYDKIIIFSKILHEYTNKIKNIYIYGSSYLFNNFINIISSTLNFDISKKIIIV
jgi:hypothetical protein